MSNIFPFRKIVRRSINSKKPFLIEWESDENDKSWEPWSHLPEYLRDKYCKSGKVRKSFTKKRKRKEKTIIEGEFEIINNKRFKKLVIYVPF